MSSTESKSSPASWAGTAGEWTAKIHHAELPSGMRVLFRFPSLGEMIASDALPEELLEVAVAEWADPGAAAKLAAAPYQAMPEEPTDDQRAQADEVARGIAEKIADLNRHVIAAALVEPQISAEELASVPYTDLEYLARMVNRAEPFDAAGRRIGPEPISTFRVFAEEHDCAADCPACESARRKVSTVQ